MNKAKQKTKVKKEVSIIFRCTDKERDRIRLLAEKEGLSISEYIRSKVLK